MKRKELSPAQEKFAQARFAGSTADEAYVIAGHKQHRGNASRMANDPLVKARVAELNKEAAAKITGKAAYHATAIFDRLLKRADKAAEDGDHKAAIDAEKFIAKCLGYEDSPTLTQEHVNGRTEQRPAEPSPDRDQPNVIPLTKALGAMQKIRDAK